MAGAVVAPAAGSRGAEPLLPALSPDRALLNSEKSDAEPSDAMACVKGEARSPGSQYLLRLITY